MQGDAVWCSGDAVCCSVSQCVAVCCSVMQCVAVCCSVSHCATVATIHRLYKWLGFRGFQVSKEPWYCRALLQTRPHIYGSVLIGWRGLFSQKSPIFPHNSPTLYIDSVVLFCKTNVSCEAAYKSLPPHQRSCDIFQQKKRISTKKHILPQKNPIFPQKNPIFPPKNYVGTRATFSHERALYFCRRNTWVFCKYWVLWRKSMFQNIRPTYVGKRNLCTEKRPVCVEKRWICNGKETCNSVTERCAVK